MPRYHEKSLPVWQPTTEKFAQNNTSSYELVGKMSPSGKMTVGRVPLKKVINADVEYERTRAKYEFYEKRSWHYEQGLVKEPAIRTIESQELGLSSVSNYHKGNQLQRHGLKGISQSGRKVVREACYMLEQRYKGRLGFYTLTCPYTDSESIYSYNKNISYIQRSFFQELKRHYERHGVIWSYVSVLEVQAKRFKETGIPVLHIHYVAPCYMPGGRSWIITSDEIRVLWGRVLSNTLACSPETGASVDSQVIQKSATGYISKYLSKGGGELTFLAEICPSQIPSQWWSTSRNVRTCVRANTCPLPLAVCQSFISAQYGDCIHPEDLLYLKYIYVQWNAEMICVGLSADIAERSAEALRPFSEWQKMYGYL